MIDDVYVAGVVVVVVVSVVCAISTSVAHICNTRSMICVWHVSVIIVDMEGIVIVVC